MRRPRSLPAGLLTLLLTTPMLAAEPEKPGLDVASTFLRLLAQQPADRNAALSEVRKGWRPSFVPMVLEVVSLSRDRELNLKLIELLETQTKERIGYDVQRWWEWQWQRGGELDAGYPDFKAALYGLIDPKFRGYFNRERQATIRLDEVRWGGVRQDGIPPLRAPKMLRAAEASYLADNDVVFGIEVGGDARAYPKRILAWHEMFVDVVGGEPVAGVYCTLCGTVILFKTRAGEVVHEMGTSGFLYRSNKLMYDQATQSLWNTFWGEPVIGPLVGKGIRLERGSVVTSTWGEWRRRHPETLVLSLDTGHQRDYSEGAAYRDYFATDELMFNVPKLDRRLKNKSEVLALLFAEHPEEPLAISADYLRGRRVYHDQVGGERFVVLTDSSGANRVYEAKAITFKSWDGDRTAIDEAGVTWTLSESRLEAADGRVLLRLPAHRAFWFGWYSAYPHTRLVQ